MKAYIKPEIELVNIYMESMIAESPQVFTDEVPPSASEINIRLFDDVEPESFPKF